LLGDRSTVNDGAVRRTDLRTFHFSQFQASGLAERKGETTISVCLPARNEAETIGRIVAAIRSELMDDVALIDELIVIDDRSTDATADLAMSAGAIVLDAATAVPGFDDGPGKGAALWSSLHGSKGDLVIWCDADIVNFDTHFITGLIGPLLADPEIAFIKGFYQRPGGEGGTGGGRVTELVARPLLALLFPELQVFDQPLSGEYGGRRSALERVPFVRGYGVEIALLIDLSRKLGLDAMAQVDLGARLHRNRPTYKLAAQATEVLQSALRRAAPDLVADAALLQRLEHEAESITYVERPPLIDLESYRARP
jgi:glucosyl-3-phosphoglycerate synthase